jgi:hypothetical protein
MERILNRFRDEGIIDKKNRPKHCSKYIVLKPWQIVEIYTSIIKGMFNYYMKNITIKTRLTYIYYLLKYSCYKTIANREKSSISKVIKKYGREIKITVQNRRTGESEKVALPTYDEIYEWAENIAAKEIAEERETMIKRKNQTIQSTEEIDEEFLTVMKYKKTTDEPFTTAKANLRSTYKMMKHCSICEIPNSFENPIEMHHVKYIKKGKLSGFKAIMKALNRRTIPVCRKCHRRIHKGEYDGISLKDIKDIELIVA